jgi:hypothetical protein
MVTLSLIGVVVLLLLLAILLSLDVTGMDLTGFPNMLPVAKRINA